MKRMVVVGIGLMVLLALGKAAFSLEEDDTKEVASVSPIAVPAAPATEIGATTLIPENILLEDALPGTAKSQGNWVWDTATVGSGGQSHGHPSGKGLQSHGVTLDSIPLPLGSMITQQVWLDPKDPPKGLMLKFKLATGEEVGVYWEGEEEVFNPGEEEEVWYYGLLPELGKWSALEVLTEDLGIEEEQIAGITFITFDGRALWDKTALTQAPPLTEMETFPDIPVAPSQNEIR